MENKTISAKSVNSNLSVTIIRPTKGRFRISPLKMLLFLARNVGIRDIAEIKRISIKKNAFCFGKFQSRNQTKQRKYKSLQVDELWTFMKKRKIKGVDLCLFS